MVQPSADQQQQQHSATNPDLISRAREVGKEFVFIYYMSVNKCPNDLHRFYASSSLFIHGGREPLGQEQPAACGQAAIADRIASLNLFDCRTKILMVDSMPDSGGDGVLIQVCGEISNNAGPMRRFMQTFLLSPSGPKKYFVQRDIFRYQDEVFTDAEASISSATIESAEAAEPADAALTTPPTLAPPPASISVDAEPPGLASPMASASAASAAAAASNGEDAIEDDQPMSSGLTADEDDSVIAAGSVVDALVSAASTVPKEMPAPIVSNAGSSGAANSTGGSAASTAGAKKNFAALFAGGSTVAMPPPPQQQQAPRRPAVPVSTNGGGNGSHQAAKAEGHPAAPPPQQQLQQLGPEHDVPDNQQVFVGNIKAEITEAALAAEFSQFGKVVSCRITANRNRVSPGFGFVSFTDPAVARKLIEMKRITSSYGDRLNLEEKKSSGRRGGGFGRGGGGGRVGGGGGGGGGGGISRR